MAIGFWKKKRILRRFGQGDVVGGYRTSTHKDFYVMLDVQTTSRTSDNQARGSNSIQKLKAFGSFPVTVATNGKAADMLWFQGKWFECIASRLSDNTVLNHWTSEFVECINQAEPPDESNIEEMKEG